MSENCSKIDNKSEISGSNLSQPSTIKASSKLVLNAVELQRKANEAKIEEMKQVLEQLKTKYENVKEKLESDPNNDELQKMKAKIKKRIKKEAEVFEKLHAI